MGLDPNLTIYLREISRVPLLSAEKERELARLLIRENDAAARDLLIRSNLRLVVRIARAFVHRGLSIQDLIEEGNLGLLKAVDGFNPELNIRFSTYASWWIRQAVRRALAKSTQPIHVPGYMMEMIGRWKEAVAVLRERLGRDPTVETLSRHMKMPARKVRLIVGAIQAQHGVAQLQVSEAMQELPERNRTVTPAHVALRRDEISAMRALLENMEPREARILRLRYGLDDEQPRTLGQVGAKIGLTRERVRQIENGTLEKLRRKLSA